MILRNNSNYQQYNNVNGFNLLEYILSIAVNTSSFEEVYENANYNTSITTTSPVYNFLSYFPTSIIQLFILIFLISLVLCICKCYKILDLLRQRRKLSREKPMPNSLLSYSPTANNIHYHDESSFKDNCCCYWLSRKYYYFRRLKRRIFGFRKAKSFYNQKSRFKRGKRRLNNLKGNSKHEQEDSIIFRRRSIMYRSNRINKGGSARLTNNGGERYKRNLTQSVRAASLTTNKRYIS